MQKTIGTAGLALVAIGAAAATYAGVAEGAIVGIAGGAIALTISAIALIRAIIAQNKES